MRRVLERALVTRAVDADAFAAELARAYNQGGAGGRASQRRLARDGDLARLMQDLPQSEDLLDDGAQAPVIRMINALLLQALRERASDLHFEPYEARSVVRFRVDGVLRDVIEPPRALHAALVSRLKIMASLDIAEKRLPQDGRIALKLGDKQVDVRVSTLPTGAGERVVLRLLDKDSARLDLTALGMSAPTLDAHRPPDPRAARHRARDRADRLGQDDDALRGARRGCRAASTNMMTVEDPIEYALDGVAQTQVNPRIELTFARALRAILRQDPDVIMIGEIRDLETAQIAVQASLTGHLVLATLHTNDAASAVTRLADMGVEPYLLASSLLGVLAQRLVRTLCPACRASAPPTPAEARLVAELGLAPDTPLASAAGCGACNHTGYRGRTGVYELLVVDETMRRLIHDGAGEHGAARRRACAPACARCAPTARAGSPTARRRSPSCCASRATREARCPRSAGKPSMRAAQLRHGVLDADTPRAARDRLRADGLTPDRGRGRRRARRRRSRDSAALRARSWRC